MLRNTERKASLKTQNMTISFYYFEGHPRFKGRRFCHSPNKTLKHPWTRDDRVQDPKFEGKNKENNSLKQIKGKAKRGDPTFCLQKVGTGM